MTYGAFTQDDALYGYRRRRARQLDPRLGFCIVALGVSASVGGWALCQPGVGEDRTAELAAIAIKPPSASPAAGTAVPPSPVQNVAALRAAKLSPSAERRTSLIDPELTSSYGAVVFARNAPLRTIVAPVTRTGVAPVRAAELPAAAPLQIASLPPQILPEAAPVSPLVAEPPRRPSVPGEATGDAAGNAAV